MSIADRYYEIILLGKYLYNASEYHINYLNLTVIKITAESETEEEDKNWY